MSEQLNNPEELFRKEAIQFSESSREGKVVIAQPLKASLILYLLIVLAVAIVLFLVFVDYEQTRSARGQIRPALNTAQVTAPKGTSLVELFVNDGDLVEAGQPLFKVKHLNYDSQGNDLLEANKAAIQSTLDLYNEQLMMVENTYQQKKTVLDQRIIVNENKLKLLQESLVKFEAKYELLKEQIEDFNRLYAQSQISKAELYNKKIELLDFEINMNRVRQEIDAVKSEILGNKESLIQLALLEESEISRLKVSIEDKNQIMLQVSGEKEQIIKAGISGKVTNINNTLGGQITTSDPIMQIVPNNSRLLAEVYISSQDIGFIKTGQKVRMALDAFPYQKYGYASGTVNNIGETAIGELSDSRTITTNENQYRVLVELDSTSIHHQGRDHQFVPGMMLKGFIYGDRRSLFQWLFEPVYGVMERYQS